MSGRNAKKNYYDNGIHIFWLDEAEPEYAEYNFENYRYFMGTALQVGNIYPQMYSRPDFRELLIRWFQWGCFCPVMRLHGDRRPSSAVYRKDGSISLFTGSDNEVWSFGAEAYEILVKYIKLRELLRPYTRSLMQDAHENGAPVMRPMFFEFPEDQESWLLKDQYMFGPDMLVAPIMEAKAVSRRVYLPAGAEWTALHSGKKFLGGNHIIAEALLDVIPVFIKNNTHPEFIGGI